MFSAEVAFHPQQRMFSLRVALRGVRGQMEVRGGLSIYGWRYSVISDELEDYQSHMENFYKVSEGSCIQYRKLDSAHLLFHCCVYSCSQRSAVS